MPIRLDTSQSRIFAQQFADFLDAKRESAQDVEAAVRAIIADVVARGDQALVDLTRKFDRADVTAADAAHLRCRDRRRGGALRCEGARCAEASHATGSKSYHRRQMPKDERYTDALGVELGYRWTAVAAAGLYVPGGSAAYPSSVLMNAVPAKVAGVPRLVMVVPTPDGKLNPLVLAAAKLAGVDEIYRDRRRAGGRGARLRHGDDQAGRQDRRPRQRLCRGREAAGVRQGRHRHDRRSVGSADRRGPRRQSGVDRR